MRLDDNINTTCLEFLIKKETTFLMLETCFGFDKASNVVLMMGSFEKC